MSDLTGSDIELLDILDHYLPDSVVGYVEDIAVLTGKTVTQVFEDALSALHRLTFSEAAEKDGSQ